MDADTLKALAGVIAKNVYHEMWPVIVWQLLLVVAAGAIGAFGGEYLKARGKNLATKKDFDELKRQLEANTELVERVKLEVGRQDWSTREWINLRRVKLEELLAKVHECEVQLHAARNDAIDGKSISGIGSFSNELRALGQLYFPELAKEIRAFESRYDETTMLYMGLSKNLSDLVVKHRGQKTQAYMDDRQILFNQFSLDHKPLAGLIAQRDDITLAARALLESIMNVRVSGTPK